MGKIAELRTRSEAKAQVKGIQEFGLLADAIILDDLSSLDKSLAAFGLSTPQ